MEKDNRYNTSGTVRNEKKTKNSVLKNRNKFYHQTPQEETIVRYKGDIPTGYYGERQDREFSEKEMEKLNLREEVEKYGMGASGVTYSMGKKKRWEKFDANSPDMLTLGNNHKGEGPLNASISPDYYYGDSGRQVRIQQQRLKEQRANGPPSMQGDWSGEKKKTKKQLKKEKFQATTPEDQEDDEGLWTVIETRKGKKAVNKNKEKPTPKATPSTDDQLSYVLTEAAKKTKVTKGKSLRLSSESYDSDIHKEKRREFQKELNLKNYFK